ncbi:hypothetical protein D3C80_297310 [compost metagenome]
MQGTAGTRLQVGTFQVFTQAGVVHGRQQNAPHRCAIGRQAPAHRQVDRNQPLHGGRTGYIKNVVTFERGHVGRLVQLVADAVQVRLGGNRQRRRRQVRMPQRQHFGQQRIGAPVGGGVTQLDQRVQATAYRRTGDFGAVADLGDGQVTLAFLESLDDCQASRQGGHEVRVAGKGLDALCRGSHDRRCQGCRGRSPLLRVARLWIDGIVGQGFVTHRTPQKKRPLVRLSNKRPIIAIDR